MNAWPETDSLKTLAPGAVWTCNHGVLKFGRISLMQIDEFRRQVLALSDEGGRLIALVARPATPELIAILAFDPYSSICVLRGAVEGDSYQSLTPEMPSAQAFEREIFELYGIRPEGHPWLKPLRRHADLETPAGHAYPFFSMEDSGLHEVAVGPVHAGVIEPGHFRFQCAGEKILHLEIQLGYQHRGVEAYLKTASPIQRVLMAESIAGDTVLGHVMAHVLAVEALAGITVSPRAQNIRCLVLELERLANHIGDLGALCGDVGFLPGSSWFGRLRGDFLNLLLALSGNRFGHGLVSYGGVRFDITPKQQTDLGARLAVLDQDRRNLIRLVLESSGVMSRFEGTGPLPLKMARTMGLVGPAARASGLPLDVRRDHPDGGYRVTQPPLAKTTTGDVMARMQVRADETDWSVSYASEQLRGLPDGPPSVNLPALATDSFCVSLEEGWRGEIAHLILTDGKGDLDLVKVVDPSFHNWFGLALAMRGQPISDFPLCNKSFNLSYAGHDL